jgi:NADPH:quinone reductase-like Zn-dependent oxidoreductase
LRVISASSFGPPEVLRFEERPVPRPNADEAIVEVKAVGVNLMDSWWSRLAADQPPRSATGSRGIGDGTLDVLIDRTYPLRDAATAHRDIESQKTVGKLLLLP